MILSKFFKKVFITESNQQFSKTIAIVCGSFKFPTIAHWYMIEQYTKKADEVVVIISDPKNPKSIRKTSTGTIITAQMSKNIFDLYINRYGFQGKVKAIISSQSSPIAAGCQYIENLSDVNVIFGTSKKNGDETRFNSIEKYFAKNEHINLLSIAKTAVIPYVDKNGKAVSATDARNNLDNPEILKTYLPEKLTNDDVQKVLTILKVKPTIESEEMSKDNLKPCDETESIHLDINDELLSHAKLNAYNVGLQATDSRGKEIPVNPKKFPEKAVDIIFPVQQLLVEVFLDAKTKKWDSNINYNGINVRLSPEQMEQFFMTKFYRKLMAKLQREWPLSDELYGSLYEGVANKEMQIEPKQSIIESDEENNEERDEKTHSPSGRKYMNFGDLGVNGKSARFICWPVQGKEFKWSTWKDWKKIKPLCRMRFKYSNMHEYGVSISVVGQDYELRGFRGYDITAQPPLQYLSVQENDDLMKLSLFNKFVRYCIKRISKYVNMDPEEIYAKINNPEKITVEEIEKTQRMIRNTLNNIIKKKQSDTFKWA